MAAESVMVTIRPAMFALGTVSHTRLLTCSAKVIVTSVSTAIGPATLVVVMLWASRLLWL
ncbi:MAG: hypothetical protein ACKO97_00135 [Actinomycetota bacterium]